MKKKRVTEYGAPLQVCRCTEGGILPDAVDAFPAIDEALSRFRVAETLCLDSDGYIGIPIRLTLYTDPSATRIPARRHKDARIDSETEPNNLLHPKGSKRLAIYCINTNTERIGKDSDASILLDLLHRGFHVLVLDYRNERRAQSPDIDWSIQGIRCAIEQNGSYLQGLTVPKSHTYVIPAGYTIKIGIPYFHYFEHGVDGLDSFIVDVWNRSLHRRTGRFAKGERFIVRWGEKLDGDGNPVKDAEGNPVYKPVTPDAVWEDEEQRRIKICYTVAESWWDCVKASGETIDPNLYLDLTYPTHPSVKVPVMTCHSSSEERNGAHTIPTRPIMTGYLFRGYAAVTFDHAYTPMAKTDHLGYFEGEMSEGRRTDFTLRFVTGMGAMTAPIRLIRKLAELYPDEYAFNGRIGSYGHSKGAPTNILGTAHPEKLPPEDYLPGRHGECRKPQPFSHYEDGTPISSSIQLCYTSNGGGGSYLFEDQCPTVVTQGESDGPFRSASHYGAILSTLRSLNVPTLDMSMPKVGHTTIYGYSEPRGFDMYNALYEFSDYYLKDAPSACEYILPRDQSEDVSPTQSVRIKLSGEHTREEIERGVTVTREDGRAVRGLLRESFRGNEWCFIPLDLRGGERVTVRVDEGMRDRRGVPLLRGREITYRTREEEILTHGRVSDRGELKLTLKRPARMAGKRLCLRLYTANALGRIGVYLPHAEHPIAVTGTARTTRFDIDLTPYVKRTRRKELSFVLRPLPMHGEELHSVSKFDGSDAEPLSTLGGKTYPYDAPDSYKPPMPIGRIEMLPDGAAYSLPAGVSAYLHDAVPMRDASDLGRAYRIEFDAMSPEGRAVHAKIVCHDDPEAPDYMDFYSESSYLAELKPSEWRHCSFTYLPDREEYCDPAHRKASLSVMLTASLRIECDRLYLRNLRITELGGVPSIDPTDLSFVLTDSDE